MDEVALEGVSRVYGRSPQTVAMNDVSFAVQAGEMLVLLGPSGCGKTTTLRCIAGLETPSSGVIRLRGADVYNDRDGISVPTHRRDIGLVFQSFALWPHLSARQNIEFPLRGRAANRKTPSNRASRAAAVERVAAMVELPPTILDKRPGLLSGGQQQRVALARALVAEPSVLLLDEPLSNLDARLREQLREELRALHQRLGFTGVYVTHDLQEALTLGDRVAVMDHGRLVQLDSPARVFEKPSHVSVAKLLGFRHLCRLTRGQDGWMPADVTLSAVRSGGWKPRAEIGLGAIDAYIKPHSLVVSAAPPTDAANDWYTFEDIHVRESSSVWDVEALTVELGGQAMVASVDRELVGTLTPGGRVSVSVRSDDVHFFSEDGSALQ